MDDRMITVEEAANLLDVSTSRIRQLVLAGILKGQKLAGAWFFTREAIEQARERNRKPGPKLKGNADSASEHTLDKSGVID